MRVYISGAITGTSDYLERFQKAENYLVSKGFTVVNPARVNKEMPSDTTWKEYMVMSFCMLSLCDAIYMLNGWENSRGATIEHNYAVAYGIPVMEESLHVLQSLQL